MLQNEKLVMKGENFVDLGFFFVCVVSLKSSDFIAPSLKLKLVVMVPEMYHLINAIFIFFIYPATALNLSFSI